MRSASADCKTGNLEAHRQGDARNTAQVESLPLMLELPVSARLHSTLAGRLALPPCSTIESCSMQTSMTW